MPRSLPALRQALFLAATLPWAPARGAAPASYDATFTYYGSPQTISFRAWAPDEVSRIRGVVFSMPGSGGDSRGTTANTTWQRRMRQMGFAFVGVRDAPGDYWGPANEEGAANIQAMLDGAANALGRPEISNAPIFMFGISHGGFAVSSLAQSAPARTLGFYADKGATGVVGGISPAQQSVPGMMTAGSMDDTVPPGLVYNAFDSWGPNSQLALGIMWGIGHVNTPDNLLVAYMQEVVERRYPSGQLPALTPNLPLELVTLPLNSGWLGQANTVTNVGGVDQVTPIVWPTIAPYPQYGGSQPTSWLPSEAAAMLYRAQIDRPEGLAANAFTFTANYSGSLMGAFALNVNLTGTTYSGIDLYDDGQLISHLGYSAGAQQVIYPTVESGNHTFVAVATYTYNGQTHYTSKFATLDTFGPSTSDYLGDFDHDRMITGGDLSTWTGNFGKYDYGLRGDSDGDADVDGGDFLSWQQGFGKNLALTTVQAVPEPSGGAMAAALVAATLLFQFGPRWRAVR